MAQNPRKKPDSWNINNLQIMFAMNVTYSQWIVFLNTVPSAEEDGREVIFVTVKTILLSFLSVPITITVDSPKRKT